MEPRPEQLFDVREFPVLYVDDEPENLRIFELAFRREFTIRTAASGEEGLEILATEPVAVILSDHKMPGMTGVEFLARAQEIDPKALRLLVTAYGDADTLGRAINDGSIYRYVPKPWSPEDMRVTLLRAIEAYALDRERDALVRELGTINNIAQTITGELSVDRVFDLLLGSITGRLEYDAAALLLYDQRSERLRFARYQPDDDAVATSLNGLEIPASAAPAFVGAVLRGEYQVLAVADALDYETPVRTWVTEVAAEQIVVVPLMGKKGAIGALAVDNRRGSASFGVAEQTLLSGIAAHAAVAIQNAEMVEDLRQSRLQVLRADRLGTLGTLAAGLAHEINNPLVSIHTFLSLAAEKREEEDAEFWGEYHDLACREVDRIRNLVSTMRRIGTASPDEASRIPCDLEALAEQVVKLVSREAGSAGVEIVVDAEPEVPKVLANPEQVHQVLLNLLLNGIHACEGDGTVRVHVRGDSFEEGEGACIELTDDGHGISEDDLERIFDPFYTTKGPDVGSGLGLMICHRIVSDHQGSIEVASRPGEGATFRLRLPSAGV
jgi:signal transduction histidine kinase